MSCCNCLAVGGFSYKKDASSMFYDCQTWHKFLKSYRQLVAFTTSDKRYTIVGPKNATPFLCNNGLKL